MSAPLKLLQRIKRIFSPHLLEDSFYQPKYRILHLEKDDDENYLALVQMINKNQVFKMKPEEILSDDALTDSFSPRDIRTLTYLGYLGINSPKYKILAKRLSENDENLIFFIKEKGSKKPIVKTAGEISSDKEILKSLDQKDAHLVGYTTATEQTLLEEKQRKALLDDLKKLKNQKDA